MIPTLAFADSPEDEDECCVRDKLVGDDDNMLEGESVVVVDRVVITALGVSLCWLVEMDDVAAEVAVVLARPVLMGCQRRPPNSVPSGVIMLLLYCPRGRFRCWL